MRSAIAATIAPHHGQPGARRVADRLRVDVLMPEHHGDAAAREMAGDDNVGKERDVAEDGDSRICRRDPPAGMAPVRQFLADSREDRVAGEGAVHRALLEGEGARVARLEAQRALARGVRRAVLVGDFVSPPRQRPAQLRLSRMARIVVHDDARRECVECRRFPGTFPSPPVRLKPSLGGTVLPTQPCSVCANPNCTLVGAPTWAAAGQLAPAPAVGWPQRTPSSSSSTRRGSTAMSEATPRFRRDRDGAPSPTR